MNNIWTSNDVQLKQVAIRNNRIELLKPFRGTTSRWLTATNWGLVAWWGRTRQGKDSFQCGIIFRFVA